MPDIVLASGSPRRRELIAALGLDVELLVTDVDESVPDGTPADVMVRDVAARKADAARRARSGPVVVAADTTVVVDSEWLTKPEDDGEATRMLSRLRGRDHLVFTGVAVARADRMLTDVTVSTVSIAPLSEPEVAAYVAAGEGLDKAGAYSVQGQAGSIVSAVDGCYTNVVGLPLCALAVLLVRSGVRVDAPAPSCGFRTKRRCPHPVWRPDGGGRRELEGV